MTSHDSRRTLPDREASLRYRSTTGKSSPAVSAQHGWKAVPILYFIRAFRRPARLSVIANAEVEMRHIPSIFWYYTRRANELFPSIDPKSFYWFKFSFYMHWPGQNTQKICKICKIGESNIIMQNMHSPVALCPGSAYILPICKIWTLHYSTYFFGVCILFCILKYIYAE